MPPSEPDEQDAQALIPIADQQDRGQAPSQATATANTAQTAQATKNNPNKASHKHPVPSESKATPAEQTTKPAQGVLEAAKTDCNDAVMAKAPVARSEPVAAERPARDKKAAAAAQEAFLAMMRAPPSPVGATEKHAQQVLLCVFLVTAADKDALIIQFFSTEYRQIETDHKDSYSQNGVTACIAFYMPSGPIVLCGVSAKKLQVYSVNNVCSAAWQATCQCVHWCSGSWQGHSSCNW